MTELVKHGAKPADMFDRFDRAFDALAPEADVTAIYKDGILEVRVPARAPEPAKMIEITKS